LIAEVKKYRNETHAMKIVTQNTTDKQEENAASILYDFPYALSNGSSEIYLLVENLHEDLERFIIDGNVDVFDIYVLPKETEIKLLAQCRDLGFTYRYRSQSIEYMHHRVMIWYLQMMDSKTGRRLSLIPWFMLPGRCYPVFVYLYAINHYEMAAKKSQCESAAAAAKVFGINTFNKSTLCRNVRQMEPLLNSYGIHKPHAVPERKTGTSEEFLVHIPELLRDGVPDPTRLSDNDSDHVSCIWSTLPLKLMDVIKPRSQPPAEKIHDTRKRPTRPRKSSARTTTCKPDFVESSRIDKIRREFINISRDTVLNTAKLYHRFLI
jgi:hypothetical protein